jgi:ribosome biogenesis GTPase A
MLATSHIIGTKAYIESEVAVFLAEILLARYRQALAARYSLPAPAAGDPKPVDAVGVIEAVAAKRGFRLKGGGFDFDKAAITLLTDYRSGALGRVSLETPASRSLRPAGISNAATIDITDEDSDS